uniref:Uncharacterized protein n=1 Tax=Lotus japonicus TaxID=34305 RepID=I3SE64_LOTJA|nr:unknown [Lotus japonicus]
MTQNDIITLKMLITDTQHTSPRFWYSILCHFPPNKMSSIIVMKRAKAIPQNLYLNVRQLTSTLR